MQKKADLHRLYETSQYGNEENWKSFEEIENLFQDKGKFRRPKVYEYRNFIKHKQLTLCLSVFDHFWGLALKGLIQSQLAQSKNTEVAA